MTGRKVLIYVLVLLVLVSFVIAITGQLQSVSAMPAYPTDETKVPHYFGPYPNWANSPFTLADAQVVITGNGSGAEAVALSGAERRSHRHHHHQPGARLFAGDHRRPRLRDRSDS